MANYKFLNLYRLAKNFMTMANAKMSVLHWLSTTPTLTFLRGTPMENTLMVQHVSRPAQITSLEMQGLELVSVNALPIKR